jgi:hypothetical protein
VAAAAQRLSRKEHIGLGEAVNRLARAVLRPGQSMPRPFQQRTAELGLRVDVSNVADALEQASELGGPGQPQVRGDRLARTASAADLIARRGA